MKKSKKLIAYILAAMMIFCSLSVVVSAEDVNDNYVRIYTKDDLRSIAKGSRAHYVLMNDLVFTYAELRDGGKYYTEGYGWKPIENFSGIFDGNGYSIKNLYIEVNNTSSYPEEKHSIGLFAVNNGEIKNLKVYGDVTLKAYSNGELGMVCARNKGTIANCHSYGNLKIEKATDAYDSYAGGICGWNEGTIVNCSNSAQINGISQYTFPYVVCGGIVGGNKGDINSCFNKGSITLDAASDSYAGGIIGRFADGYYDGNYFTVRNSYNTAVIKNKGTGQAKLGGIGGEAYSSKYNSYENCYNCGNVLPSSDSFGAIAASNNSIDAEIFKNCYYLEGTSQYACASRWSSNPLVGSPLSAEQMKLEENFEGFDFENVWFVDLTSGIGRPQLTENPEDGIHRHKYTKEITKAPTCTEEGIASYTCACTKSYTEEIPALGHDWAEITYTWSEDLLECTALKACKNDSSHFVTEKTKTTAETIAPTCENDGSVTYTAAFNNKTFYTQTKTETLDAINHKNAYLIREVSATCTSDGYTAGMFCPDCKRFISGHDLIKSEGHHFADLRIEPTCTEKGKIEHTCTDCRYSYTETINAKGHSAMPLAAVPATCTQTGLTAGSYCSSCGVILSAQQTVPVTDHTDHNNDGCCDICGADLGKYDPSADCSCNCHKSGISNFFWKIGNFFHKIFGMSKYKACECGAKHW